MLKLFSLLALLAAIQLQASTVLAPLERGEIHPAINQTGGLPCGNFALSVSVNSAGKAGGLVLRNPGQLNRWLEPAAHTSIAVLDGSEASGFENLKNKTVQRAWPFAEIKGSIDAANRKIAHATLWVPAQRESALHTSLPVIMLEVALSNQTSEDWETGLLWDVATIYRLDAEEDGEVLKRFAFSSDAPESQLKDGEARVKISLAPGESRTLRIALALYDAEGYAATTFESGQDIADYSMDNWVRLKQAARQLDEELPTTGDAEIDNALRWYAGAGIYLTRLNRHGAALTMGYTDLNQRDSYWSSWIHLVLWPELERRMVEASAAAVARDGKVPTTILAQKYERPDDIDINAYFVLRVLRYANYHDDWWLAYRLWPQVVGALDWMIERAPDGLPVQGTYWGDWKDVPAVHDRKYSPHASLLYLAALDRASQWAPKLGREADGARFKAAYEKGHTLINRSIEDGGLWNGSYYEQVWKDGTRNEKILQDQTVGILFGVVEPDKATSIHDALAANRCPLGVRETFPYYPESFGYQPGSYHNGGIWPYLSFADAWSRLVSGRTEEGLSVIRDTARADLSAQGDWLPHEYVQAETGANEGKTIQAWNASLFGALYFGTREDKTIP